MDPGSASRARIQHPRESFLITDQSVRMPVDNDSGFRPCLPQALMRRSRAELIAVCYD